MDYSQVGSNSHVCLKIGSNMRTLFYYLQGRVMLNKLSLGKAFS